MSIHWARSQKTYPVLAIYQTRSGQKLSGDQQDQIGKFPLIITMIKEGSDEEIQELFLRLQEGVVLNPAEKRNAMLGNMRNFIADLGADHSVFPLTRINGKRFGWHNLAAIVTCLEKAEGPTDVKAQDLSEMYDNNNESFNDNGPIARKVKRHLNYMARVLKDRPTRMNIKWGFVDLYLLISEMDRSYVIRNREVDFANFYVAFETERRAISDPRELIAQNRSDWDRDLYDYIQAFVRSGGIKQNIKTRHEVYKRRFLRDTQDLIPKDPQRAFTYNERVVIWHRDNETCQSCGNRIEFDQMEADHKIPHIMGGQTIIDNGQTLCRQCNAKKGAT